MQNDIGSASVLARVPFLRSLEPGCLARVEARLLPRHCPKGETVCREGDPCDAFWIVERGSVSIQKSGHDGRLRILETCGPGGTFALVAVLDGGRHPATVVAREPSRLLCFSREALEALVREAPEVGLEIARMLAGRLRRLTCEVAAACLQSVRGRLALLLLDEAARGQPLPEGGVRFQLEGSQEELAHRIGTEREVLARALRALREEGVIEQSRSEVRVPRLEKLRAAAGG